MPSAGGGAWSLQGVMALEAHSCHHDPLAASLGAEDTGSLSHLQKRECGIIMSIMGKYCFEGQNPEP